MRRLASSFALSALAIALASCGQADVPASAPAVPSSGAPGVPQRTAEDAAPGRVVVPNRWPVADLPPEDPNVEARVEALLARMTLEEKVGQTIQAELQSVTPEDVRAYNLGSVLNGGGSAPGADLHATPQDWLALADAFWEASTDTSDGGVGIPVIWGTDAVHGHNAAFGATIFPHNIGLGAANDPELMRRLGRVAAEEARVTGHDWTFGPTVAVPQDDRWGRAYEGFSEDPAIVASLAGPYVEGLQGYRTDTEDFLGARSVIATAKHFLGDGGTDRGVDQGDVLVDEETLIRVHGAGYVAAIEAGVQTVMASYSSFQGVKMHGAQDLLTGVLKERMGFDGFVVGDWNGHGQIPGCTPADCPAAMNAGIDMYMVPTAWRELYENTLTQVENGVIPMARLDDAVRRILRVKVRAGLFEQPRPSERPFAGDAGVLHDPLHRETAREAVRKSLVLLKNNGVLPIATDGIVMVAGPAADNLAMQTGGWSLTWQGAENDNDDFPGATSIWDGVRDAVQAGGGTALLSVDGVYDEKPAVAIVVFGETPYAEGVGDRDTVAFSPADDSALQLLRRLRADGIPVVSVFLSGRPLWVNREINASDAFVAAWLPGTEGGGVADVLIGQRPNVGVRRDTLTQAFATQPNPLSLSEEEITLAAAEAYDFTGRLSFSWPNTAMQTPLNAGQPDYDPLFALGYGLSYDDDGDLPELSEDPGVDLASLDSRTVYFARGATLRPWRLTLVPPAGGTSEPGPDGRIVSFAADTDATLTVSSFTPVDLSRETNAVMTLTARLRILQPWSGPISLSMSGPGGGANMDVTEQVAAGGDVTLRVPLACFADSGVAMDAITQPFGLTAQAPLQVEVIDVRLTERAGGDACPS